MQCYSGIAPVKEASGNKANGCISVLPVRSFCARRSTSLPRHSIGHSEWAKAYYEHLRNDKNKEHHAAVRSLAFKWIRIIFRCWKDGKPYDEEIYLQSLRRRGSLLGAALGPSHQFGCTMVAGFQKLSENNA